MSHCCGQKVLYESRARSCGDEKAAVKAVRPKFERPPLIEQAITVVFDDLAGFSIGDFGRFWTRLESEFPVCEQAPPLPTSIEQLGAIPTQPEVRLMMSPGQAIPRCLYRNPSNGEAMQLQENRFTFNWAKLGDAPYPHSERTVSRFTELFRSFERFVMERDLGPIKIKQCEITNVNILPVREFGRSFADAPTAITVPRFSPEGGILHIEAYSLDVQYLIADGGSPLGRLHVVLSPVVHSTDATEAYKLELTARSGHGSGTLDDVLVFFDVARSAVNTAFLTHTTKDMWQVWGLKHG
jgi:uncharacterized protein (TIGR04255 family)